jgi:hypothetical protein
MNNAKTRAGAAAYFKAAGVKVVMGATLPFEWNQQDSGKQVRIFP